MLNPKISSDKTYFALGRERERERKRERERERERAQCGRDKV